MRALAYSVATVVLTWCVSTHAEDAPVEAAPAKETFKVTLGGLNENGYIAPEYAYCAPSETGHTKDGQDKNPEISWTGAPEGTKSFALITVDTEVPTSFENAGVEGKTIPESMPRQPFYHWVMVNIPSMITKIPAGADSDGFTLRGKSQQQTAFGLRGINDYAKYMESNADRKGVYAGYDGPCPPWNDERVHKYHFKVYALDVVELPVSGTFGAQEVEGIIKDHTLASDEVVGLYSLNPNIVKR